MRGTIVALGVFAAAVTYAFGFWVGAIAWSVFVGIAYCYRDPRRSIPSDPLGVVSPVDGHVVSVDRADIGGAQGLAIRVRITVRALGSFVMRSPIEGKILGFGDARETPAVPVALAADGACRYRVQTDEHDDLVLCFGRERILRGTRVDLRIGERVGQGQRCGLASALLQVDILLPAGTRILIAPGDRVRAGSDVIAQFVHSASA